MKLKTISRIFVATYLLSVFFAGVITPISAFALDFSKPLAGDTRCGGTTACSITAIFTELKDVFIMAIVVIAFFALVALIWTGVKGLTAEDQPAILQATRKQAGVIISSVLIAIFLIGGLAMAFFKAFVKPEYYNFFGNFFSKIEDTPILGTLHANAQVAAQTPSSLNPLVVESVYDVAILLFQLAMRWIMIPVLIGSWVWAGFLFIQAQGNPERINYARQRLWYSFIWTLVLMFALGVAFAFRDTFNQIFT